MLADEAGGSEGSVGGSTEGRYRRASEAMAKTLATSKEESPHGTGYWADAAQDMSMKRESTMFRDRDVDRS